MSVNVIIADDHKIMREGLRTLIEKQPGIKVVGEAETGREALKKTKELEPDIVVMDITMPDLNGIEATRYIKREIRSVEVIALSIHSHRRFIWEMLDAGAAGYVLKNSAFKELVDAIEAVSRGQKFLSAQITTTVIEQALDPEGGEAGSILTPREREVLQLLSEGHTTKEMAAKLFLSARTVEAHRANLMKKLEIHNVAGLTKYAIREGLTSTEDHDHI